MLTNEFVLMTVVLIQQILLAAYKASVVVYFFCVLQAHKNLVSWTSSVHMTIGNEKISPIVRLRTAIA